MPKRRIRSFRIYPDNGEVYFEVLIYPSRKSFNKSNPGFEDCAGKYTGCNHVFVSRDGSEQLGPCIGTIRLCRSKNSIAVHEITHATVCYFRWRLEHGFRIKYQKKKRGWVPDREECFCTVLSNLVIQFWNKFHRDKNPSFHVFPWNKVDIEVGRKPREKTGDRPTIRI